MAFSLALLERSRTNDHNIIFVYLATVSEGYTLSSWAVLQSYENDIWILNKTAAFLTASTPIKQSTTM